MNIPGLSERTLRRDIAKSDVTTGPEIQVCIIILCSKVHGKMFLILCVVLDIAFLQTAVLQSATTSNPNACWWIKADGVDVVKGLCESTKGLWSGDVDLNDGHLQLLFQGLQDRLQWIKGIGLKERSDREAIKSDLHTAINNIATDLQFIHSGTKYLA